MIRDLGISIEHQTQLLKILLTRRADLKSWICGRHPDECGIPQDLSLRDEIKYLEIKRKDLMARIRDVAIALVNCGNDDRPAVPSVFVGSASDHIAKFLDQQKHNEVVKVLEADLGKSVAAGLAQQAEIDAAKAEAAKLAEEDAAEDQAYEEQIAELSKMKADLEATQASLEAQLAEALATIADNG